MVMTPLIAYVLSTVCVNYNATQNATCALKSPKELLGRTITLATLSTPPLSDAIQNASTNNLQLVGIARDFMDILQEQLGFEYDVKLPPTNENFLGNNDTGIINMLNKREVDMAAAFLPVFPYYPKVIDYSVGLLESNWVVLMKRPQTSAAGSGLLAPFDDTVWYLILVALILVGPAIYILLVVRYWLVRDELGLLSRFPLSQCVWFVFGALMKQGSTLSPISDSSRVLFATWWIFITILTSFYTANLTAFLTLSKFTLPINTAKEMATKRYKWIVQEGGAMEYVIKEGYFDYLTNYMNRGYGKYHNQPDKQMFEEVEKNNRMFLREKNAVEQLMYSEYNRLARNGVEEKERCKFVMAPEPFMARSLAFAYTRNSDLAQYFDPLLQTLVETGIVKYLMRKDLPKIMICPLDLGSKERQLRNADLWMTYLVVITGFSTSIAVFMAEMIIRMYRYCQGKQNIGGVYPGDWQTGTKKSHLLPYNTMMGGKLQNINGTDYSVAAMDGDPKLYPVRSLFQYSA